MKKLVDKVLSILNISNGRDWVVFLLALLLAFSIWIIHNLALKYNDYLSKTIAVNCSIAGHSSTSSNTHIVTARCRATGYRIINSKFNKDRKAVGVNLPAHLLHHKGKDEFYLLSDDLLEYSHQIFGQGVTVDYFVSDTLIFHFPEENYKKVPVKPTASITYGAHYMNGDGIRVNPDSVLVYGEPFRLEKVFYVSTNPIKYSSLESDVKGEIGLKQVNGLRFSVDKVEYSIDVLRFVEMNSTYSLNVENTPSDKSLLIYPSIVRIKQKWRYPLSAQSSNALTPFVDYNEYESSLSGKCKVHLDLVPDGLISYEIDPPYVECKIVDR